jgi:hypothetical protein
MSDYQGLKHTDKAAKKPMELDKDWFKQIYSFIVKHFELTRLEARIFFRLLGFLLTKEKPFVYTTGKLAANEQYSMRSVARALNSLENLLLIERIGHSYRRTFQKGVKLIEICKATQKSTNLRQEENSAPMPNCSNNNLIKNNTHMSSSHSSMSVSHSTKSEGHITELKEKEENKELKKNINMFINNNNKNKKIEPPKHDPYYQEYVGRLKSSISLGLLPQDTPILLRHEWRAKVEAKPSE